MPVPATFEFLALLIFLPWRWKRYIPPKRQWIYTELLVVTTQNHALHKLNNLFRCHNISFSHSLAPKNESFLTKYTCNSKLRVGYYFPVVLQLVHSSFLWPEITFATWLCFLKRPSALIRSRTQITSGIFTVSFIRGGSDLSIWWD
jgi:hypothetical protein